MPRASLRLRLTLAFAAGMTVVSFGVATFVYVQLRRDLDEAVDMGLRARAQVIVSSPSAMPPVGSLPRGLIDEDEAFAQLLTPAGDVVEATGGFRRRPLVPAAWLSRVRAPAFLNTRPAGYDSARLLVVPVHRDGRRLYVVVGATLSNSREALNRLLLLFAVALPAALIVSSIVGWLLAGAALRPVRRMNAQALAIGTSDPDSRLPVPRSDRALAQLATTLNETFDRLRDALRRERAFVDNASHELRTPLTILKAEVDSALSAPRTDEELRSALAAVSAEVEHLVRIAEGLLVLARANGGRIPTDRRPTDLAALVGETVCSFERRAAIAGVSIETAIPAVSVEVDPTRLRQAIVNLVDNALRHTRPGGAVAVTAALDGGTLALSVSDDGAGFSAAALEHAFEPFNRGVEQDSVGAGLGLAIAAAIADAHGGGAVAENLPSGGARVTLRLHVPADRVRPAGSPAPPQAAV